LISHLTDTSEEDKFVKEDFDLAHLGNSESDFVQLSLIDILGFDPELVGFQRHEKHFVGQAYVEVYFGLPFAETSPKALF